MWVLCRVCRAWPKVECRLVRGRKDYGSPHKTGEDDEVKKRCYGRKREMKSIRQWIQIITVAVEVHTNVFELRAVVATTDNRIDAVLSSYRIVNYTSHIICLFEKPRKRCSLPSGRFSVEYSGSVCNYCRGISRFRQA